jgi:hypothetical protein
MTGTFGHSSAVHVAERFCALRIANLVMAPPQFGSSSVAKKARTECVITSRRDDRSGILIGPKANGIEAEILPSTVVKNGISVAPAAAAKKERRQSGGARQFTLKRNSAQTRCFSDWISPRI